jgi:hypothetical protein
MPEDILNGRSTHNFVQTRPGRDVSRVRVGMPHLHYTISYKPSGHNSRNVDIDLVVLSLFVQSGSQLCVYPRRDPGADIAILLDQEVLIRVLRV